MLTLQISIQEGVSRKSDPYASRFGRNVTTIGTSIKRIPSRTPYMCPFGGAGALGWELRA